MPLALARWLRIPSSYDAPLEIPVEEWIMIGVDGAPAFQNNWVNFDGSDLGRHCGFYKDPFGVVHLKGTIRAGTMGQTVFTLTLGYRPEGIIHPAVGSNIAFGMAIVNPDGQVNANIGSNNWFDLSQITFRAVPEVQVL